MIHEPRPNLLVSDEGYSVEVYEGRSAGIRYSEGPRSISFPSEDLAKPYGMVILIDKIIIWDSPYNKEVVDITKRIKIIENIREAFRFWGWEIKITEI
jgi:hypothetical protein